jgi:hypothetical protein
MEFKKSKEFTELKEIINHNKEIKETEGFIVESRNWWIFIMLEVSYVCSRLLLFLILYR